MFATVLIFAFVTSYVTAEIPSYIHICGRRDPNIEQCIVNNIYNLKDKICQGMPELDIPSHDPLRLSNLVVSETNNMKIYITNTQIYGLCDFIINHFHLDLDKFYFNITILYNNIHINSTYDIKVHILVPIFSKGQITITSENVNADVSAQMKIVTEGDKRYMYFSKMILNLDINDFTSELQSNNNSEQWQEIINNLISNNKKEMFAIVKPAIEEAASKQIISFSNNIIKHFTYEELFPDRT